jgi:histone H3/H4
LVRELAENQTEKMVEKGYIREKIPDRWNKEALEALQEVTENYLTVLLTDAYLVSLLAARRKTLMVCELNIALVLRKERTVEETRLKGDLENLYGKKRPNGTGL